jgi:hypothetical protein
MKNQTITWLEQAGKSIKRKKRVRYAREMEGGRERDAEAEGDCM